MEERLNGKERDVKLFMAEFADGRMNSVSNNNKKWWSSLPFSYYAPAPGNPVRDK
jgi:hypothetical protein